MLNDKQIGNIWTPEGPSYGPVNSLVGRGESIVNLQNQTGSIVRAGQYGQDTVPSNVQQNDDNTIFGNLPRPNGQETFAQAAAPYTQQLEQINNMEKKYKSYEDRSSLAKRTAEFQQKQFDKIKQPIMQKLNNLAQEQQRVHQTQQYTQYNCGKLPGFNNGSNDDDGDWLWNSLRGNEHMNMFGVDQIDRYANYTPMIKMAKYLASDKPGNSDNTYTPWNSIGRSAQWMENMPGYWDATRSMFNNNGNPNIVTKAIVNSNIPYTKNQPNIIGRFDGLYGPQHASPDMEADYIRPIIQYGRPTMRKVPRWDPKSRQIPTLDQLSVILNKPYMTNRNGLLVDNYYTGGIKASVSQKYKNVKSNSKPGFWKRLNDKLRQNPDNIRDYHTLPSLSTAGVGLLQYLRGEKDDPKGSNVYTRNNYEDLGLTGLAGLRQNPYEYLRQMYDAERRGAYQIANSANSIGKANQRIALALGSQSNIAKQLSAINEANLTRKQHYYDQALATGAQNASRRQDANKYDFETYTKAHAAKEQMKQMGLKNMLSALWQYNANAFKRDIGNKQLKLYNKTLDKDQAKLLAQIAAKYGV